MPFQKGQSGNPGGRPKTADGLRKTLEEKYGDDARQLVDRLDGYLASKNERVSLEAWKVAMGYYFGQPTQKHEHDGAMDVPVNVNLNFGRQPDSGNKS